MKVIESSQFFFLSVTGKCNFPKVDGGTWYVVETFNYIAINCSSGLPPIGGDTVVECGTDGKWKKENSSDEFHCKGNVGLVCVTRSIQAKRDIIIFYVQRRTFQNQMQILEYLC
jgi:hypothetical protein